MQIPPPIAIVTLYLIGTLGTGCSCLILMIDDESIDDGPLDVRWVAAAIVGLIWPLAWVGLIVMTALDFLTDDEDRP